MPDSESAASPAPAPIDPEVPELADRYLRAVARVSALGRRYRRSLDHARAIGGRLVAAHRGFALKRGDVVINVTGASSRPDVIPVLDLDRADAVRGPGLLTDADRLAVLRDAASVATGCGPFEAATVVDKILASGQVPDSIGEYGSLAGRELAILRGSEAPDAGDGDGYPPYGYPEFPRISGDDARTVRRSLLDPRD